MELVDIKKMLDKTGLPVAYHHFNNAMSAPFLVYCISETEYFYADDTQHMQKNTLRIELYTDIKDVATEKNLESILSAAGICFLKSEIWIDEEKLYEIIYESEVI